MSLTSIIYISGLITSFVLVVILILTLYRLSKTTVTAVIESINCSTNDCKLNIVYYYNSIKVNAVITSKFKEWQVNQTLPIYINPKDLTNPRYTPMFVNIILYAIVGVLLMFMALSTYRLFNIYQNNTYVIIRDNVYNQPAI